MKRLLPLIFLGCAAFAGTGELFVVERTDSAGTSVAVVRQAVTLGQPAFVKVGAMAAIADAPYAAAPSPTTTTIDAAHVYRAVRTAMAPGAEGYRYETGKLPQLAYQFPNLSLAAVAPFGPDEAVGYDSARNALVILRPHGIEYASDDNFLSPAPMHDIALARIEDGEVLLMYSTAASPPQVGYPADYTATRVHLYARGKASSVVSYPGLKKIVGTRTLLSHSGAYYVTADMHGQFLAHRPILGVTDKSPELKLYSMPFGATLVPIGHGAYNYSNVLEVQMGDDLWALHFSGPSGGIQVRRFFSTVLEPATVTRNSHGNASHRVLSVTSPSVLSRPTYEKTFNRASPGHSGTSTPSASMQRGVATRFEALWKTALKQNTVPTAIATVDLAFLLNNFPTESNWLYELLTKPPVTDVERSQVGLHKGTSFHAVDSQGTLKLFDLYDLLSALPSCGAILAANP